MSNGNDDSEEIGVQRKPNWGWAGEAAKYTTIVVIIAASIYILRKKLTFKSEDFWDTLAQIPRSMIVLAILVTALNYIVLAGYDWIAVRYLKKTVPLRKILTGAIIGYAISNVLGWILGGSPVRFLLYTRWGFKFVDVIAFISVLTVTFWLGMFMLSGIAFVLLPVKLPDEIQGTLHLEPFWYGCVFLSIVALYLLATLFVRKPIRIGKQDFVFPPFRLSLLQLAVSASDFALASLVLYLLLPHHDLNYSLVLVAYLAAMIAVVITHVPGGVGVFEVVILAILSSKEEDDVLVLVGLVLFRIIYYLLPFIVAIILFVVHEVLWLRSHRKASPAIESPPHNPK